MDEIRTFMEENKEQIIKDIKFIVEADSPTDNKTLADECKKRIQLLLKDYFGYEAEEIVQDEYGDHLRFEYGTGDETILILSHYDTVWNKGDLELVEEKNRIYGPGILDMKGGLVQTIWALKAIKDLELSLNKKIVFLCTSDEEVGSPSSEELITDEALNSTATLVTEPPVAGTKALKSGRKGSSRYYVDIYGKAAHSGNNHEDGVNAIKEAAQHIVKLESLTDYDKGTTINVGSIEGGGKLNVIPDHARFGVNVRVETEEEQKRIDDYMNSLSAYTEGIAVEVFGGINRPPMTKNENTVDLLEVAQEAADDIGMGEIKDEFVGGGSDANFTANLGVPTLDGLGAVGAGIHAQNEHIVVDEVPERASFLCSLIVSL
ncbi:M20 family metallopeptidase [Salinicoccus cyprini]|uniref:M20 family metallopeptidase n=1 Tax=Salinicoccus cyprini TaxID=2493691 RepID=A0A558AXD6_9STAP|nr:M20 family metallopeptidase [Salinicoccus cyprini]TVT28924.1 M20 family metallopeptidase [Salinicoccus cyprini]